MLQDYLPIVVLIILATGLAGLVVVHRPFVWSAPSDRAQIAAV